MTVPAHLSTLELVAGKESKVTTPTVSAPRLNWDFLIRDTEGKMAELRQQLASVAQRPWDEQVDIRDRLLELNKELTSVIMLL